MSEYIFENDPFATQEVETVYHECKTINVNGQNIIDKECEARPTGCLARNVARKLGYKPTSSHKDTKTEYGISRTDIVTIKFNGTEKQIEQIRKKLRTICAKCTHNQK